MVKGVDLAVDKKITKVKCGKYCADFTDGGSENELIREYGFDADFLEKMISESLGRI